MTLKIKNQQGSFFAEIGAVIASISILTLISTNYIDSMAGRAQVTEAFVLMAPIVQNVNDFYAQHGVIGGDTGNYAQIDVYDNDVDNGGPDDYAGRYVETVTSYTNGVVMAKMNSQFSDGTYDNHTVGKVGNVQEAIQDEYIFLIPFLIGDTTTGNKNEATVLRWGCLTTIDAKPPTGEVLAPLNSGSDPKVINEQYYYAPGCVVISNKQANCLDPTADSTTFGGGQCSIDDMTGPVNWNTPYASIVGSPT